jgi:hypothetical protein
MTNKLPEVGKEYLRLDSNYKLTVVRIETDAFLFPGEKYKIIITFGDFICEEMAQGFDNIQEFWNQYKEIPTQTPVCKKSLQTDRVEQAKEDLKYHIGITTYFDKGLALSDVKDSAQNLLNALDSQKEEEIKCDYCSEKMTGSTACSNKFGGNYCSYKCANQDAISHKRSSLICECGHEQESVYPASTQIEGLECGKCRIVGGLRVLQEEEIDIWKPVSELPCRGGTLLVKYTHHSDVVICSSSNGSIFYGDIETDLNLVKEFCFLKDFVNQQQDLLSRVERLEQTINQNQK